MPLGSQNKTTVEQEIISMLQAGDKGAISLLYQNYAEALYGMIKRTITSQEAASEVLQDVFLKVWQNRSSYDQNKGKLFTWLAQISRNASIDYIRSGKYKRSQKTDRLDPIVYNSKELSETLQITDSGLQSVIKKLDPKYYKLIFLIYFQGYTHTEVAEILDIPLGTVKTRIRAALKELRKTLGNESFVLAFGSCAINLLSNSF